MLSRTLEIAAAAINEALKDHTPAEIIAATVAVGAIIYATKQAYDTYKGWDTYKMVDKALRMANRIPYVRDIVRKEVDKEIHKTLDGLKAEVDELDKQFDDLLKSLPDEGLPEKEILAPFDKHLTVASEEWKKSGATYVKVSEAFQVILEKLTRLTNYTNPMHDHWPLLPRLEGRVIEMCRKLFHGREGTYGIITHGGTDSINHAIQAYVRLAKTNGTAVPEIIVPETAHPAFDKASELTGAKFVVIPVDENNQVDLRKLEAAINKNTCVIVGSAPSYPFGVFDPIKQLGEIALRHKVPLHVDGCLGGYLTPFLQQAAEELKQELGIDIDVNIPQWDFNVPGVTTLSADLHKYGYAPKGISTVFFSPECQASPSFAKLKSYCGMYVTEGIDGSRSGEPIAHAYAALLYHGKKGYLEEAKKILLTRHHLVEELKKIEGIQVMYNPQHAVVGIQADPNSKVNMHIVANHFQKNGWSVNMLLPHQDKAFHFCLTSVHANKPEFVSEFTKDMQASVTYAMQHSDEKLTGIMKAYGALPNKFVPKSVADMMGSLFCKIRTMPDYIPGFSAKPETTQEVKSPKLG